MKLTFVTDLGQSFVVEIDPDMELENVMALLEAEVSLALFTFVSTTCHVNLYSVAVRDTRFRAEYTL